MFDFLLSKNLRINHSLLKAQQYNLIFGVVSVIVSRFTLCFEKPNEKNELIDRILAFLDP